jgi:hypothetical protein
VNVTIWIIPNLTTNKIKAKIIITQNICIHSNINNKKIITFKNINDFFDVYIMDGIISGNSGGYSDITFLNNKTLSSLS